MNGNKILIKIKKIYKIKICKLIKLVYKYLLPQRIRKTAGDSLYIISNSHNSKDESQPI